MKMLRLMLCLVAVLWLVAPARAQDETGPHDGVTGLVDCGGELSPADRMHCENVQLDAADENLNRIYRTLMEVLDKEAKAMLLDGQRGWLKYRDRNLELFSSAASPAGQTGMAEQIHWLRKLTEERVRELENLYRLFQENGLLAVKGQDAAPEAPQLDPLPMASDEPDFPHSVPEPPAPVPAPPAPIHEPPAPAPEPPVAEPQVQPLQPEAPAPVAEVQPPAPAPRAAEEEPPQPAPPVPSKGVIILNGKVVRPSDFGVLPEAAPSGFPPPPEPQQEPAAAPAPTESVQVEPAPQPPVVEAPAHAPVPEVVANTPQAPAESAEDESPKDEVDERTQAPDPAAKTAIKSETGARALIGRHPLRLQWLSSEPIGVAAIENRGGTLYLSGSQGRGKNHLEIEGIVTTVREDNFTFHGTVTTATDFLNQGKPCVRSGRMWFVRKDGRPFWRLQSITNPCTGVSDYIDIYLGPVQE